MYKEKETKKMRKLLPPIWKADLGEELVPYSGAIQLPKEYIVDGYTLSTYWPNDPSFGAIVFLDYGDFPTVGVIEE